MVSRNTVLKWIQRGAAILPLAIVLYLSRLAEFGILRTMAWLLLISLVIGAVTIDKRKVKEWKEGFRKLQWELKNRR